MVNIKDVAKEAGVSISTVSRALSGKRKVGNETKKKVMKIIEKLGYEPNNVAQALKDKKTKTIAMIIPDIRNPIYPLVVRGAEDYAKNQGYTLILCNTDENIENEISYIAKLKKRYVDGFIISTNNYTEELKKMVEKNIPIVSVVRSCSTEIPSVTVNNFMGAHEACNYLINRKNTKIALITGDQNINIYKDRFLGYKKALQDNGIRYDKKLILEIGREESKNKIIKFLTENKEIDAIFAANDTLAVISMSGIAELGKKIPEDISIIGFDNQEMSMYTSPKLSTVSQPFYEIGERAAKILIEKLNANEENEKNIIYDCSIIIRETTK